MKKTSALLIGMLITTSFLVFVPDSVEATEATLDDPTEDGYIQWGDYLDSGFQADRPDEPPVITRFADGNQINFGLGSGYWHWYWIPGTSFQPGRWEKDWRAHKERGYVEWDISSLAGGTLTANPVFRYEGGRNYAYDERINPITEGQPSVVSDGALFNYIASGTPYVDPFVVEGNQNESVDLGASARSDLQNAMDAGQSWFAIGFKAREIGNMALETQVMAEEAVPTPPPTLYVEYTSASVTIDTDVSPDAWLTGNVDVGTDIQENFTFYQNGSATIDITIGINDTNLTFVNYTTWLSLGHDRYCANFTIDNWVSENMIEPGYPPNSVLKASFAPGNFTFGVRIWMPRTVTYSDKQEDFEIVLVVSESS